MTDFRGRTLLPTGFDNDDGSADDALTEALGTHRRGELDRYALYLVLAGKRVLAPIVAILDKKVVGLIGLHRMVTVHRPAPVGRIPVLVVSKDAQGHGLGRMLVDAAEQWCRKKGCQIIEVD